MEWVDGLAKKNFEPPKVKLALGSETNDYYLISTNNLKCH